MRERLVEAMARASFETDDWHEGEPWEDADDDQKEAYREDATVQLTSLARALREDREAVEAMQDPFRIGDARGKLAKLCDYLEGKDG